MSGTQPPTLTGSALARAADAALRWPSPTRPAFVAAGAYTARRGQNAPPHHYAVWKLTYYRSGQIDAFIDDVRHPVRPGTVLVVPPHADHAELAHTDYANFFVLVNARPDWPWPAATVDDGEHRLADVFAALAGEMSAPDDHAAAMVDALTRQLDITLQRALTRRHESASRSVVNAADRLLEERHAKSVRIEDVARDVGVSTSTLRAYFAAELGLAPQARLAQLRLRHAVALLQTSDLTLASVADRCGYHSASHLSRHVKAVLACTPGELRTAPRSARQALRGTPGHAGMTA